MIIKVTKQLLVHILADCLKSYARNVTKSEGLLFK